MKIKSAIIQFNERGNPVASEFDDVYFSNDDGAAETRYVFIEGNQLRQRFETCTKTLFVIAETGFGTGLNCALAMAVFDEFRQQHPDHPLKRLYFVSVEKHPLSPDDLSRALVNQPTSDAFKSTLLNHYPSALSGAHRIEFLNTRVDLWLGDAVDMFNAMPRQHFDGVDAWFLDGFAPSKNPDMWSQSLFDCMAKLSAPGATLATFTAAGFVRRGLIDAGFAMQKVPGYGRKREMLTGSFGPDSERQSPAMPFAQANAQPCHIAILGAGLAGANMALSLAKRGCKITMIEHQDIASGASGNPQGGFYPQLHAQVSNASLIQAHSFLYARRYYQSLVEQNIQFEHDFCGALLLGFSDPVRERQEKMQCNAPWPDSLTAFVDAEQASQIANVKLQHGGIFIPLAGWISPPQLVHGLIERSRQLSQLEVFTRTLVEKIEFNNEAVILTTSSGQIRADHLVVATGAGEHKIPAVNALPFGRTRGQVESVPVSSGSSLLRTVLCHKGYFTPKMGERQALGSTYLRNDHTTDYRREEADTNLNTHKKALPDADFLASLTHDYVGRAAVRMTLPDHQPAVGVIQEPDYCSRLSVLCGLGSRGLTTAPLMAEILAAELFGEPMPITRPLYEAVHYARFDKRARRKAGEQI